MTDPTYTLSGWTLLSPAGELIKTTDSSHGSAKIYPDRRAAVQAATLYGRKHPSARLREVAVYIDSRHKKEQDL